jgi:hypothetical protein
MLLLLLLLLLLPSNVLAFKPTLFTSSEHLFGFFLSSNESPVISEVLSTA